MYLSKLTSVLLAFDRGQMTQLKKFIHSEYFGLYPPAITLFDFVALLYPRFSEKKLNPETIRHHSKNLSTAKQQEAAATRLLRGIEQFIALEEWQKSQAEVNRFRLKGFKALPLREEFKRRHKKEMALLEADTEQHCDIFFERHLLTELAFDGFEARMNRAAADNDLGPVVKTLDEFHAIKKLRYLCEMLNRHQVYGLAYQQPKMEELFKILKPYTKPEYPYVYLFVNVYRMLEAETFEDCDLYYRLIKQMAERSGATAPMREAMGYAINRCLHWNNKGHAEGGSEYLWWIEWRRAHNLLFENGKLMPVTFRNILTIAVTNGAKAEEIEKLINTYASYLPEEHHHTYLAFANGLHHYTLGNYKKAIRFFLMAQAKEVVVFNCLIRRWEWMCYYEMDPGDIDALHNHLSSFEKYLLRSKAEMKHLAGPFEIFLAYAEKLVKATRAEQAEKYREELQYHEHFPGKPWLMRQLEARHKKTRTQGARVKQVR